MVVGLILVLGLADWGGVLDEMDNVWVGGSP